MAKQRITASPGMNSDSSAWEDCGDLTRDRGQSGVRTVPFLIRTVPFLS